jgi:hypothetical protein
MQKRPLIFYFLYTAYKDFFLLLCVAGLEIRSPWICIIQMPTAFTNMPTVPFLLGSPDFASFL